MKSKVVPLRIPDGLDELAGIYGKQEHLEKATVLRQWMYRGAERAVLELVSEGRISIGRGAELLDLSIWDMHRLAQVYGIELGATIDENRESYELVDRIVRGEFP